jgi:hypothetical protein
MWFRSAFDFLRNDARGQGRRPRHRQPASRLLLELLEDRTVPSFLTPVDYTVGQAPRAVATGDFTNDGIQDLVTCNQLDNTVSVLLGKGDGSFQPARTFATGPNRSSPWSVAVGDFTGDGKLDIVTANHDYSATPNTLSVLLGNGDGTFQAPRTLTLPGVFPPGYNGSTPLVQSVESVAVGDMNHDGKLDLVVTAQTSFRLSNGTWVYYGYVDVLLGHGDGTFAPAMAFAVGTNADRIALADFNDDGNLDVAVESQGVSVLLGKGDGTLGAPTLYAAGVSPGSLAVGDFNGDGKLDLVTTNYTSDSLSVLMGNGDGTFLPAVNLSLDGSSPSGKYTQQPEAVVVGDLNHDGKLDLAVTANTSFYGPVPGQWGPYGYYPPSYGWSVPQATVDVLLGEGDGTFTEAAMVPLNGSHAWALTTGDFNSDTFPDLAVADLWANTVSVLLNGADWSTTLPPSSFAVSGFPSSTMAGVSGSFTVTALNADGTTDTGFTGTVHFTSSDGQGALPADYTFKASDAGVHTFSAILKTAGTQSLTAADGSITGGETGITVAPAAANHLEVTAPAGSTAGNALSVTVTALDPYNNLATGYAGTVSFASSDARAGLPGAYTFGTGDAGVHTFANSVILKTAGSQTITATDTASLTGSAAVTVSPAAASKMLVAGFPSPTTAAVAGSFTVTLEDAYGNIASGYRGTVHFTSSDGKAILPANYTFTATDAGAHTFSATLKTAGTQWITATDTTTGSLRGTDTGITVKPAAASKFILTAPATVSAGGAFSLTVTALDAYGNVVTGYTGTVHFSSTDTTARLPANYTFTATDQGVHTFIGLVLRKKGYQKITITDTHNSSLTGSVLVDVL